MLLRATCFSCREQFKNKTFLEHHLLPDVRFDESDQNRHEMWRYRDVGGLFRHAWLPFPIFIKVRFPYLHVVPEQDLFSTWSSHLRCTYVALLASIIHATKTSKPNLDISHFTN